MQISMQCNNNNSNNHSNSNIKQEYEDPPLEQTIIATINIHQCPTITRNVTVITLSIDTTVTVAAVAVVVAVAVRVNITVITVVVVVVVDTTRESTMSDGRDARNRSVSFCWVPVKEVCSCLVHDSLNLFHFCTHSFEHC